VGGVLEVNSNWNIEELGMNSDRRIDTRFWCVPVEIALRARNPIILPPYPGSTIRGGLGIALITVSCVLKRQICGECPIRTKCIYTYLFETPLFGEDEIRKRFPNAPHPFVLDLEFSDDGRERTVEEGEEFSISMKLIGRAGLYIPHFISAFSVMGDNGIGRGRGRFDVKRVSSNGEEIYTGGDFRWPEKSYLTWAKATEIAESFYGNRITLRFITPLRLVFRKELCRTPEFHILIGNLIQRVENLCYLHCESNEVKFNKAEMIALARTVKLVENRTSWMDWERYSHRQRTRMKLGGLMGTAVYEGELRPFLPLLILGSWVHAGKNTSFGLGRYEIDELRCLTCF
jgi:hypothetical protein